MNRTIKFRGQTFSGSWIVGDLLRIEGKTLIAGMPEQDMPTTGLTWVEVKPETVGQFIGQVNGRDVYEGDVFAYSDGTRYVVTWNEERMEWRGTYLGSIYLVSITRYDLERDTYVGIVHELKPIKNT